MISEIWSCKLRLYAFSLKSITIITDSCLVHFYINDFVKKIINEFVKKAAPATKKDKNDCYC